jgi:hypothetical protein
MYSKNPKGLSFDPLHSFLSLLDFDFKLRFLYYQLRFGSKLSMLKFKQKLNCYYYFTIRFLNVMPTFISYLM